MEGLLKWLVIVIEVVVIAVVPNPFPPSAPLLSLRKLMTPDHGTFYGYFILYSTNKRTTEKRYLIDLTSDHLNHRELL